jgi:regulatory protein YycI of two-component signal transduction system YycFG
MSVLEHFNKSDKFKFRQVYNSAFLYEIQIEVLVFRFSERNNTISKIYKQNTVLFTFCIYNICENTKVV